MINMIKDDNIQKALQQQQKHKERMKRYYNKRKEKINMMSKKKFDDIYQLLNSINGYTDITKIDENVKILPEKAFICLCFNKLHEAFKNVKN